MQRYESNTASYRGSQGEKRSKCIWWNSGRILSKDDFKFIHEQKKKEKKEDPNAHMNKRNTTMKY